MCVDLLSLCCTFSLNPSYVRSQFATLLPQQTLKHHFNVSNSYVLSKMRLLLFPWMHKPWARRTKRVDVQGGGANHEWCTPREDVNSPDLYIPGASLVSCTWKRVADSRAVMAIVTYILLTGLHAGVNSAKGFKPQILGESASRATLVVMFDFLFVKLGCVPRLHFPNQIIVANANPPFTAATSSTSPPSRPAPPHHPLRPRPSSSTSSRIRGTSSSA